VGDYVTGAEGTGFQRVQGLFKAIPNFETTMWIFKFTLEMPTDYFDSTNYLFQWATYQDTDATFDEVTVACGIKIGDEYSEEVFEYDNTFDSTADTNLPAWEQNYAAMVNEASYEKTPDTEDLMLLPSLNGKSSQSCNVRVEVPPEEAAFFFDRTYTLTVGGRLYESRDSPNYEELPDQ